MSVYRQLKAAETFSDYLIPYYCPSRLQKRYLIIFFNILPSFTKPVDGHKGQGVTFIEKYANDY